MTSASKTIEEIGPVAAASSAPQLAVPVGLPVGPAIPGLGFRAWRDVSDYDAMAAVMVAASRADGVPWVPTGDQLRIDKQDSPTIDPARDIVLVEVDGGVVACAGTDRVIRDATPIYETWGAVHPEMRRRGLGSALIDWNIARSRERAAIADPGSPVAIQAHVEQGEVGQAALVVARGFEIIRRFQLMRRDLTDPIADVPLPDGLELRPVLPDQHRAIYEAQGEAFRDHWGAREPTDHGFEYTYGRKELDTGLWVVAWDDDEIAGVIENWIWTEENETLGVERGWLERVSVRRPWRRRGLARAMTAASLVGLRDAGMTEAMLGVDAGNSNGAVALYQGVGFEVHRTEFAYRRVFEA
jgi:mycothiol synthase